MDTPARLSMTAETSSQDLTRLCLTQTQQPSPALTVLPIEAALCKDRSSRREAGPAHLAGPGPLYCRPRRGSCLLGRHGTQINQQLPWLVPAVILPLVGRPGKVLGGGWTGLGSMGGGPHLCCAASGVLIVVVEVDAQQEVLQVRLVASVHQLGHHWGDGEQLSQARLRAPALLSPSPPGPGGQSPLKRKWE